MIVAMSSIPGRLVGQVSTKLFTLKKLAEAGILTPTRPDRLVGLAPALLRWGPTPAAGYSVAAARSPEEPAIVDELGTLTFKEVHRRTNALAHALSDAGLGEGDSVGVRARNRRRFRD